MIGGASCRPAYLSATLIGRTIHQQDEPMTGYKVMCWNLQQNRKA
jgi:hypothetical protein